MTSATTTARPPAAQDMDAAGAAIEQAARALHLPAIRDGYEEAAAHALRERSTYKEFLAGILGEEVADREQRRRLRLVREAAFPRPKRIEDFDYSANPNISAEQVATLCHPAWVTAGQPLCLIGDSGTGKSHLLIGIGTAIAEAADDRQLTRVLARYGRADLLCLDELGYLELDKTGAKLLFQIFTDREERRAIAVASNAAFSKAHMFACTCGR